MKNEKPLPSQVEFDELIATMDDPDRDGMYYAYARSKCGHFYKCEVTRGSSRFNIVRWLHSEAEEVLVDGFSSSPEVWRWHHEPIPGKTRKENQQNFKDMVDWCLNRVHKIGPRKLKPGWTYEEEVIPLINASVPGEFAKIAGKHPQVEHGLCGPHTPGESIPPDTNDSPPGEDGGVSPVDGQPRTIADVHFAVEIHRIPTTQGHGSHSRS